MIGDLKPHKAYKDSGQDWLGSIPAHWSLLRAKRLFREVDERSKTGKEELLSVSHLTGVTPRRLKTVTMFLAESTVGHKVCCSGDLVINTLWAWMAALGVTRHTGLVSPAYGVYRPIDGGGILPAYADHLLRTPMYAAEYQRRSTGVNSSRLRLYPEQFLRIPILAPPLDEQALIVRFLDGVNGRLERAIRAKRKVIALLMEQKQTVIHRTVTSGLDPAAPLKPSGITWLGEIPQHWTVSPNRAFLRIRKVLVGNRHKQFQLLSLTKRGVIVRDLSEMRGKFSADMGTSQEVRSGDLVFCLFDVPETPRTVGLSQHAGMITGAYTVMECPDPEIARFLELFYIAMDDRKLLSPIYSGLRNTIPKDRFLGAKTPIPPAGERAGILQAVRSDSAALNQTISRLEREIELLREYRTRLIADVVTGRLDVREAAAQLTEFDATNVETEPAGEADAPELIDEEATEA